MKRLPVHGRGASHNPPNRFQRLSVEKEDWTDAEDPSPATDLLRDATRSVISRNDSPDVGFDAGLNPYRGCEHGCVYCYARPGHEYLGLSAGLDFETKILVKEDAPRLLRKELASPSWKPRAIMLSGVTDPYQPAERRLEVTRGCLEVLAEFRNPVSIITKSHLVTRDVDLLGELARHDAVFVTLSITTLRNELHRVMEPRAAVPGRRLDAIRRLADACIPVGVNVAPVIPGLTDHELPAILEAAAGAGALRAGYIMLRLPHGVSHLFETWLTQHFPERKEKVLGRLRSMRGGALYDATFGQRMKGNGPFARQVHELWRISTEKLGLSRRIPPLSTKAFRRPGEARQTELFSG